MKGRRKLDSSLNGHWTYIGGWRMRPKVGYDSEDEAKMFIIENKLSKKYNVYKCSVCGKWHIGHWHKEI